MTLRSIAIATLPAANRFALLAPTSGVIGALILLVMPVIADAALRVNGRALDASMCIPRGSDSDRIGSAPG